MDDVDDLWTTCASAIRAQVSEVVWQTTFLDLEARAIDQDRLLLAVPSKLVKDRIEARYLPILNAAVAEATTQDLEVTIDVETPAVVDHEQLVFTDDDLAAVVDLRNRTVAARRTVGDSTIPIQSQTLNDKLTFENFVAGTSNRFAHAAAMAVAETPARSYNPLFIYGDAGLGKTHLLQGIAHYVNSHYTAYTVRYVSCETFLNQFVEAIRTNRQMEFKRHYREVDVLLVDDIQFLEGKEGLQEEFFHNFNHLHQANKQIVLSSDRSPDAIPTLEDRLKSRFKMGLTTDIQPPDLETRLAILRKHSESEALPVPAEVLDFIATNVTDNIRELEGALTRVTAYASLTQEPLSVALAEHVLADIIANTGPRQITAALILDETSEMFGFPVEEIIGASRRRPLVTARQVGMYVCRQLTDMSYPAIAREFGNRDHTTVIHAVDKIDNLMRERRQIYDQVTALIQRIKSS
ncbi:MAG: chromosomal replication initiator protein DnaA [Acidimicrobiia bacterium]|nr:chromosomal replication initiator protein DnaA [Acidimicrobiia bacterium]MDH5237212.1 chromosomal replication initiator protein DnaA [Acidimicrobiia bacterium]